MHQHLAVVRLLNEVVQHFLGHFKVGDHTIFHGFDRDNVARSATQHLFGFFAHGFHFRGVLVDGHDRGLIHDDSFAARVHQRVGSAQVDGQIAGKNAEQGSQVMEA